MAVSLPAARFRPEAHPPLSITLFIVVLVRISVLKTCSQTHFEFAPAFSLAGCRQGLVCADVRPRASKPALINHGRQCSNVCSGGMYRANDNRRYRTYCLVAPSMDHTSRYGYSQGCNSVRMQSFCPTDEVSAASLNFHVLKWFYIIAMRRCRPGGVSYAVLANIQCEA